jgi:hypothetical protein
MVIRQIAANAAAPVLRASRAFAITAHTINSLL